MQTAQERREQQNSSCGLFLAILFVLIIFGNHGPQDPDDQHYGWGQHRHVYKTTTLTPLVQVEHNSSMQDDDSILDLSRPRPPANRYMWPGSLDPDVQKRNQQSARVVVFLFASLMFVQVLGFCVVIALRRRALRRAQNSDIFSVAVERDAAGWNQESDEEDTLESHPALANLRAAMIVEHGLPSYDEALHDPSLPNYTTQPLEPPPPISAPSLSPLEAAELDNILRLATNHHPAQASEEHVGRSDHELILHNPIEESTNAHDVYIDVDGDETVSDNVPLIINRHD